MPLNNTPGPSVFYAPFSMAIRINAPDQMAVHVHGLNQGTCVPHLTATTASLHCLDWELVYSVRTRAVDPSKC